jgi:predicted secreted protein
MSSAVSAHGSLFKVGGTTVAEITSISDAMSADELDVSSHDSASKWREFIPGLKGKEFTLEGNFLPANATQNGTAGLISLLEAGTVTAMSLVLSDSASTTYTFNGFVREFSITAPVEDKLGFTSTIRVTGVPTIP